MSEFTDWFNEAMEAGWTDADQFLDELIAEGVGEMRQWHGPITIQPKDRPEIGDDLPPGRYLVVLLGEDAE